MKIIRTHEVDPDSLTGFERDMVYNGLDCAVTSEIFDELLPQLDNQTASTYAFSRALQGPVIEMNAHGVLVDAQRKQEVIDEFSDKIEILEAQLDRIVYDGVGMVNFNWRSNADLQTLFYGRLGIPPIRKQGRPTVNRDALERIEAYLIARLIVRHILLMRDLAKKIGVLRTGIDPDGRIRTSYNISGTSTGRFSSSQSEFGTGTNLQNLEQSLQSVLIADPRMKFAKFDAKSGESYVVGAIEWNLFKDAKYLEACESGDPHTATARICWPKLPWTGNLKADKDIAEQPYYRHYSYRFMCKKLGHGSNYGGAAPTLAQQAKLPVTVVAEFQPKYFLAYPAHLRWQAWVDNQIRKEGHLVSLTGRKRWFFGRRDDPATLREAIAYDPQGSLADIVNTAMLNVWRSRTATLMMQDHDAITIQYPEEQEDEIIPQILKQLEYPIELRDGRTLRIPYDCKTGWNRGDRTVDRETGTVKNEFGLTDWKGGDKRKRPKAVHILDRK